MSNPLQNRPPVQTPQPFTVKRWRPDPIVNADPELSQQQKALFDNIDISTKTLYDNVYGLEATSLQAPKALQGSKMSSGAVLVTGLLKGVASGLGTLSNVVVSIDNGSTPTNMTVTATPSTIVAGTFDIYVWTSAPVQATSPALIRWLAWGT